MSLNTLPPMDNAEFDTLESILDELRSRDDEVPQWEFCEGAIAALLCTRRPVPADEALPVVVGVGSDDGDLSFADADQAAQFRSLWARRWHEVAAALAAPVESLDDERAYHPEVMDVRGAVAMLPEAERAEMAGQPLPAFGQVWALGFMFVVENWGEEWALAARRRDRRMDRRGAGRHRGTDRRRHRPARVQHARRRRAAQRERCPRQRLRLGHLGGLRPAPDLAQPGAAGRAGAQERRTGPQRPLPLRQRQEVQKMPRRLSA
jgi:hypothetical protein